MFDWITSLMARGGYWAVVLLMFGENVFPPIPSELIMPLAGYTAAKGELNLWGVLAAGVIGSLAGAVFWYVIGRWLGKERVRGFAAKHGRWLTLSPVEFDKACDTFDKRRGVSVLVGRVIPGVRTLISIPAGVAAMPVWSFLLFTALGTAIWTSILVAAGYLLQSQYERVSDWLDPVSKGISGLLIAWYVYRVVTFKNVESKR